MAIFSAIRAGELFQVNVCARGAGRLSGDPLDLFAAGSGLRSDFAAYLPNATSIINGARPVSLGVYDRKNKLPYSINYTLDVQWQPRNDLAFDFGYVGNLGRHLQDAWNANQPIPGPTSTASRRPLFVQDPAQSDVNYYISDGFASYFAFQFTADKRLSHGVSALLGYTYSHAIDDVPLEFGGGDAGPNPQA